MKVLQEYFEKFGEFPFLFQTMNYEDELYQNLMKKALETGKPIDRETLEEATEGLEYDLVEPDEELTPYQYEVRDQRK